MIEEFFMRKLIVTISLTAITAFTIVFSGCSAKEQQSSTNSTKSEATTVAPSTIQETTKTKDTTVVPSTIQETTQEPVAEIHTIEQNTDSPVAQNIEIKDTSGNVIVPVVNPQVSYNGYKDLFKGVVILGEINVTEYFTQADLEQWGYNIQLYRTDIDKTESDDDFFTETNGPAKNCNVSFDSTWASITEKAFAIKLPDNIQPGDYTIYIEQYGDHVSWDSYVRFAVTE